MRPHGPGQMWRTFSEPLSLSTSEPLSLALFEVG